VKRLTLLCMCALIVCSASVSALERWELDFKPGPIRRYVVKDPLGEQSAYYAIVAEVTNKSGKDRKTSLHAILTTNTKKKFRPTTNRYVLSKVRDRLTKQIIDDTPSLVLKYRQWSEKEEKEVIPCSTLPLTIPDGEKRFVVFVFERIDQEADVFDVVFSGIGTMTDRKREKVKEYSISYKRKGDEFHRRVNEIHSKRGVVWRYRAIQQ
jgi:hypothetical protein